MLVSSIAGYSKHYPAPIYCATKHAVVGFARSMAEAEKLQGVKVVCVCPGYVFPAHDDYACGQVALITSGTVL